MARDIILNVCDALKTISAASDIEEMCRYEVAQEMEYQDRILEDNEIEDIVDEVVHDEAIVDPIDNIDDGIVEMTDIEWDNVPEGDKVIDTDGDESLIIEGSIYKVSLRKDDRVERIASKISKEIESAWRLRNASIGIDIDKESYKKTAAEIDTACPDCGSYNQTLVWYDGDTRYWHCNMCGGEYETDASEYDATVEEITTEDITIYDDGEHSIFGTVFYDGELGWTYQIWSDGECIEQDLVDNPGEAYGMFNSVKHQYASLSVGSVLRGIDGTEFAIASMDGDDIVSADGRVASKSAAAVDIMLGRVFADKSDVYAFDIDAGDCYKNLIGEEVEVIAANGQEVLYLASELDDHTHDYRTEYRTSGRVAFIDHLVDKGYLR